MPQMTIPNPVKHENLDLYQLADEELHIMEEHLATEIQEPDDRAVFHPE